MTDKGYRHSSSLFFVLDNFGDKCVKPFNIATAKDYTKLKAVVIMGLNATA